MDWHFPSITIHSVSANEELVASSEEETTFHPRYLHNVLENNHEVNQFKRNTPLLDLYIDKLTLNLCSYREFDDDSMLDAAEIHSLNRKIVDLFPSYIFRFSRITDCVNSVDSDGYLFYFGKARYLKEMYLKFFPFILFYIEAASLISFDDAEWECIVMLEKRNYYPIGICSYYTFRGLDVERIRLSQFLILPWYKNRGMGAILYKSFYTEIVMKSNASEFTGKVISNVM